MFRGNKRYCVWCWYCVRILSNSEGFIIECNLEDCCIYTYDDRKEPMDVKFGIKFPDNKESQKRQTTQKG